jgi:DNA-binding winged helix-turn-helix (wHTH) protein
LLKTENIHLGFGYKFTKSPPSLSRNGKPILLTKKESRLLEILITHHNLPVKQLSIEDYVWWNVIVGESSLRSLVRCLRNKLPELSIKTVQGVGYMLIIPD